MKEMYTLKEISKMFNKSYNAMRFYLRAHNFIEPGRGHGQRLNFSASDIRRIAEVLGVEDPITETSACGSGAAGKAADREDISSLSDSVTANAQSPIDCLIAMNDAAERDANFKAYMKMRRLFENMNENDLQRFFAPLLERFKFSYICKCIPEIQSQMLTCIKKGKLRGMEKYGMDFNAFLKLIKFAHDNYVPFDAVDDQKEAN